MPLWHSSYLHCRLNAEQRTCDVTTVLWRKGCCIGGGEREMREVGLTGINGNDVVSGRHPRKGDVEMVDVERVDEMEL